MKRLTDLLISGVLLVMLFPLFVLIGLLVWINMGAPILFSQQRPGLRGRIFKIYKFRSMRNTPDIGGGNSADSERLTVFGRFLRSTSMDELPELWNVLKGEMSLVGPRPLLVEYLPLYSDEQRRRHEVRPGITGWAQINGRNAITWEEKFDLDLWYVDNRTFWLDIKILFMTVFRVLSRHGINQKGAATMERFTGSARK